MERIQLLLQGYIPEDMLTNNLIPLVDEDLRIVNDYLRRVIQQAIVVPILYKLPFSRRLSTRFESIKDFISEEDIPVILRSVKEILIKVTAN